MDRAFSFKDDRYGKPEEVWPRASIYPNGNTSVRLYHEGELGVEPWATATVNTEHPLPGNTAFIKDYSENEGMVDMLRDNGIIEGEPLHMRAEGFVLLEAYKFTADFYRKVILHAVLE